MLKTDPDKVREWQRRSRKPLKRTSSLGQNRLTRSITRKTPIASDGRQIASQGLRRRQPGRVSGEPRKRLKAKPDPELSVWGKAVRARDGNKCQFREPSDSCRTGDRRIDPHHIAPRGRRPDLIYDVRNGICLCRTHHNWCHDNPREAERAGYLNFDSYELAQKLKAGYVVPGDEDDKRVTS